MISMFIHRAGALISALVCIVVVSVFVAPVVVAQMAGSGQRSGKVSVAVTSHEASQRLQAADLPGTRPLKASLAESYGWLPLVFEANQGQSDPQVKFISRGAGYSLFLTPTEAVLELSSNISPSQSDGATF